MHPHQGWSACNNAAIRRWSTRDACTGDSPLRVCDNTYDNTIHNTQHRAPHKQAQALHDVVGAPGSSCLCHSRQHTAQVVWQQDALRMARRLCEVEAVEHQDSPIGNLQGDPLWQAVEGVWWGGFGVLKGCDGCVVVQWERRGVGAWLDGGAWVMMCKV